MTMKFRMRPSLFAVCITLLVSSLGYSKGIPVPDEMQKTIETRISSLDGYSWSSGPKFDLEENFSFLLKNLTTLFQLHSDEVVLEKWSHECLKKLKSLSEGYDWDKESKKKKEIGTQFLPQFLKLYGQVVESISIEELKPIVEGALTFSDRRVSESYAELKGRFQFMRSLPKVPLATIFDELLPRVTDRPYGHVRAFMAYALGIIGTNSSYSALSVEELERKIRSLKWNQEKLLELYESLHDFADQDSLEFFFKYGNALVNICLEKDLSENRFDLAFESLKKLKHSDVRGSAFNRNQVAEKYLKGMRKIVDEKYRQVFTLGNQVDPAQVRQVIVADILKNGRSLGDYVMVSPMNVYLAWSLEKDGAWDQYLLQVIQDSQARATLLKNEWSISSVLERMHNNDEKLVPLLLQAIQNESDKEVRQRLTQRISKYRGKKSLEEDVIPKLLESAKSEDQELALTIMGYKVQPQDKQTLRKFGRKGTSIPLRLAALRALGDQFEADDAEIFIEAVQEDPESEIFQTAMRLLSWGKHQDPRLASALLDLLVRHRGETGSKEEDFRWGRAKTNVDRIRQALWQQKLDDIWEKLNQVIESYKTDHAFTSYCLEILGKTRVSEIEEFSKEREYSLDSEMSERKERILEKFHRNLKTENFLEQWLNPEFKATVEQEAAKKALWSIGEAYVHNWLFSELNRILNPEDPEANEARRKKAHSEVIQHYGGWDGIRNNWDNAVRAESRIAEILKDETPFYLFLKAQLPETGEVRPWKFYAIFESLRKLYQKLPNEERLSVLKLINAFVAKQTWDLFPQEWGTLQEKFSSWLDLRESEISTSTDLHKKIEELQQKYSQ